MLKNFLRSDHLPNSLKSAFKIGIAQVILLYINVLVLVAQKQTFGEVNIGSAVLTVCIGLCACVILLFVRYKNQMHFWNTLKD